MCDNIALSIKYTITYTFLAVITYKNLSKNNIYINRTFFILKILV